MWLGVDVKDPQDLQAVLNVFDVVLVLVLVEVLSISKSTERRIDFTKLSTPDTTRPPDDDDGIKK